MLLTLAGHVIRINYAMRIANRVHNSVGDHLTADKNVLELYLMDCLYTSHLTTFWISALAVGRTWVTQTQVQYGKEYVNLRHLHFRCSIFFLFAVCHAKVCCSHPNFKQKFVFSLFQTYM